MDGLLGVAGMIIDSYCGLEHLDYFSILIGNVIIPTDELHHFSEG